jgi:hypothetical protein
MKTGVLLLCWMLMMKKAGKNFQGKMDYSWRSLNFDPYAKID